MINSRWRAFAGETVEMAASKRFAQRQEDSFNHSGGGLVEFEKNCQEQESEIKPSEASMGPKCSNLAHLSKGKRESLARGTICIMIICFHLASSLGQTESSVALESRPAINHNFVPSPVIELASPARLAADLAPALSSASNQHFERHAQNMMDSGRQVQIAEQRRRRLQARNPQLPAAHGQAPKLIQWAKEAVQYHEGSTLVLSCSLANNGQSGLKFSWFKQGKQLQVQANNRRLNIENLPEYSLLRLNELQANDTGLYTCLVANPQGQEDRTSTQVLVNVKLKWLAAPPRGDPGNRTSLVGNGHELHTVKAGSMVYFECGAAAQPLARIRWFRVSPTSGGAGPSAGSRGKFSGGKSLALAATNHFKLDEAQIRSTLMQIDAGAGSESFQRMELIGPKADSLATNESFGAFQKWRIESSPGNAQFETISRLIFDKAEPASSGLYECEVTALESLSANPLEHQLGQSFGADKLRKFFALLVNAPASFEQKFVVIQAKFGDSIRLECNSSGDQPLTISWFRENLNNNLPGNSSSSLDSTNLLSSSVPIEKHGNDLYDIHELQTEFGLSSFMQIRALKLEQPDSASSAVIFKCLAKNEFGSAERLIKLIVLNRPDRPEQVRVRDIWSRSALITWLAPASSSSVSGSFQPVLAPGNGISNRITNYTVQYWRKNQASGQTLGQPQNHRREEIVVDGLQNSALLINLMPAISYEISIVAFNQVGFSEPSEIINVTTSEEEPSLPPTDVLIEAKGATTLRVMWKTPPAESLNGKLLGFYVGYRPRLGAANNNNNVGANLNVPNQLLSSLHHHHHQQMQPVPFNNLISSASSTLNQHVHQGTNGLQQQQPALVYSFKTVDAIEGQLYYDSFLVNLKAGQEYEIIVRAFNKAGSGPDCHTILARTNAGAKLPPAPQLQLQKVGPTSVVLKWTTSVPMNPVVSLTQLKPSPGQPEVNRFILYYQLQGDRDWFELNVQTPPGAGYEQLQQLSGDNLNLNANNQQKSAMLLYLQDQTNEYMASQASVHTLSNLQPGLAYRIYVSAVNDYGIGDPSNILTIKTDSGSSSQAYLGAALLDSSNSLIKSTNSAGLFEGLLFGTSQQQQNLIFTTLSSISLFIILIIIAVYLIWQYKLRAKYNSSSTSSYPSSWTPAASDTIQSEYSISKRFPLSGANATSAAAAANALLQDVANYDEVSQLRNSSSSAIYRQSSRSNYNFNTNSTRTVGSQLMRNLQTSGTTARPVLSTHYHQPADLMSSSNSSATLQLHSTEIVRPSLVSAGARGQQQQQVQSTLSATLNRNQNRQLPPIPYSTLSVKEIGGPKQWRQQQPTNQMAIAQQQQQQQQGQVNYQANSGKSNGAGSQTPLIYGVIE